MAADRRLESSADPVVNLLVVLLTTAIAITMGLMAIKTNSIAPADTKAMGWFVGRVALPLLVWRTITLADLGSVDFGVIFACTSGKLVVFALTWLAAYFFFKRHEHRNPGQRMLTATIFAYFVVASNDFALGFPIIDALFTVEEGMFVYLAVNAAVSQILINPLVMILFEVGKAWLRTAQEQEALAAIKQDSKHSASSANKDPASASNKDAASSALARGVSKKESAVRYLLGITVTIVSSPIMIGSLGGLLMNILVNAGLPGLTEPTPTGSKLTRPLHEIIALVTQPFGMLALFLTGCCLRDAQIGSWPVFLVFMKVLLCAYLSQGFARLGMVSRADDPVIETRLRDFCFFYGSIPSSSAPLFFALQFDQAAAPIIVTGILFGLVLATPNLYLVAVFFGNQQDNTENVAGAQVSAANASIACGAFVLLSSCLTFRSWRFYHQILLVFVSVALMYAVVTTIYLNNQNICARNQGNFYAPEILLFTYLQNACRLLTVYLCCCWKVGFPEEGHWVCRRWAPLVFLLAACVPTMTVGPNTLNETCGLNFGKTALQPVFAWSCIMFVLIVALSLWTKLTAPTDNIAETQSTPESEVGSGPPAKSPAGEPMRSDPQPVDTSSQQESRKNDMPPKCLPAIGEQHGEPHCEQQGQSIDVADADGTVPGERMPVNVSNTDASAPSLALAAREDQEEIYAKDGVRLDYLAAPSAATDESAFGVEMLELLEVLPVPNVPRVAISVILLVQGMTSFMQSWICLNIMLMTGDDGIQGVLTVMMTLEIFFEHGKLLFLFFAMMYDNSFEPMWHRLIEDIRAGIAAIQTGIGAIQTTAEHMRASMTETKRNSCGPARGSTDTSGLVSFPHDDSVSTGAIWASSQRTRRAGIVSFKAGGQSAAVARSSPDVQAARKRRSQSALLSDLSSQMSGIRPAPPPPVPVHAASYHHLRSFLDTGAV